jgi:hypothetical protein
MKAKPSDFMGSSASSRKALKLPSLLVTRKSKASVSAKSKRETAYSVDTLEKLAAAFDENERSLKS